MTRYYRMRPAQIPFALIPFARSEARQGVARKMNPRNFALAFVGAVLVMNEYLNSPWYRKQNTYSVQRVAGNGRYLYLVRILDTGLLVPSRGHWVNASGYTRIAESHKEYELQCKLQAMQEKVDAATREAENVAKQQLSVLSQNTVTRALVHAYDNDYCHETAVALISAGHKMPDVTLSFEVTVPVTVTLKGNDSYYPLRTLFGMTRGEVQDARGLAIGERDEVQQAIREQLMSGDVSLYSANITHEGTDVEWKNPILRQVDSHEAMREVSTYRDY